MSYQDKGGQGFSTPDGKPPSTSGIPVTVHTPQGPVPGTYNGGYATPNKPNS